MDLGLRDRVYLVIGGSRGLGSAAAQALVADGTWVLLSAPPRDHCGIDRGPPHPSAAAGAAGWAVVDNADPAAPSS